VSQILNQMELYLSLKSICLGTNIAPVDLKFSTIIKTVTKIGTELYTVD